MLLIEFVDLALNWRDEEGQLGKDKLLRLLHRLQKVKDALL